MAGMFPTLEDGQVCRYPVDSKSGWVTRVNQFLDFTEQRWVVRQPLIDFVFKYTDLSRVDIDALRNFFNDNKGMFDLFSIFFNGYEYQNMSFDQDEFKPTEDKRPNRFSVVLKLKQLRPNGWFWVPLSREDHPVFPFITQGIITQRPWVHGETFFTAKIDLETGSRYAWSWLDDPLRRWEVNYPTITHDEAVDLYVFFHKMHGRFGEFQFHDPELYLAARRGTWSFDNPDPTYKTIPKCRFDMDDINLQYLGPNEFSVKLLIAEFK